ncbi:FRG domain-containing protein [Prosthecochloris marina]|uniref:FRG domain-containing protein n=1 Tax=Prosthecochloris marina TaxID=2017681 RepID=UPI00137AD27E|nr:FRG domain-containing protein [Prosthecochloris marina]
MKGQWLGHFSGTYEGFIVINIDELHDNFKGCVYLIHNNDNIPNVFAIIQTSDKRNDFSFRTYSIAPINPSTRFPDDWNNIKNSFDPNARIAEFVDVTGSWDEKYLSLKWNTSLDGHGECTLPRSQAEEPSNLKQNIKDWDIFKQDIGLLKGTRYLFRGQNKPWKLRSSFHRTGRADLTRFVNEDIPSLHKHLSARTKHVFNLDIPKENGAFFNLVQHHGYPTPLLDWTYSPYVAVFFAFRSITSKMAADSNDDEMVRIFVFDQHQWRSDYEQQLLLSTANLHLSIADFIAIDNERLIPQQAATTVTNIDDIEAYIHLKEKENNKQYLSAIDIPISNRDKAIQELRYMGITAGSLFPGLDGACEELKDRNFEI